MQLFMFPKLGIWYSVILHVLKSENGDWSDSTAGRAFALHEDDPGSIPSIPCGLLNTARGNS